MFARVGCAGFYQPSPSGVSVAYHEAVLYPQPFFADTQLVLIDGVWNECLNPTDPDRSFGTIAQLLATREIFQGFARACRV